MKFAYGFPLALLVGCGGGGTGDVGGDPNAHSSYAGTFVVPFTQTKAIGDKFVLTVLVNKFGNGGFNISNDAGIVSSGTFSTTNGVLGVSSDFGKSITVNGSISPTTGLSASLVGDLNETNLVATKQATTPYEGTYTLTVDGTIPGGTFAISSAGNLTYDVTLDGSHLTSTTALDYVGHIMGTVLTTTSAGNLSTNYDGKFFLKPSGGAGYSGTYTTPDGKTGTWSATKN